jgi:tetratricopeptide (TPR) repeat protein
MGAHRAHRVPSRLAALRMARRFATRCLPWLVLGALFLPRALAAQQGERSGRALRKSDLVRYLAGTTYTKAEIAALVRRNCLAFVPSARDRDDLRRLGATPEILREVDACVRRGNRATEEVAGEVGEAAKAPPARERAVGPVRLTLIDSSVTAVAGAVAYFSVELRRGGRVGQPVVGKSVRLLGADAIPGGTHEEPTAVTDARGRATFTVPAGTRAGTYRLTVVAADGTPLSGNQTVVLATGAAAPASVVLAPNTLTVDPGERGTRQVIATVSDAFGNVVPHTTVQLRPPLGRAGLSLQTRQTTDSGTVRFEVPTASLRAGDTLAVLLDGRAVAALPVVAAPPPSAPVAEAASAAAPGRVNAGTEPRDRADRPTALVTQGYDAARRGDFRAAATHFQEALAARPGLAAAATGLAYVELWQYDRRQAERRLEVLNAAEPPAYPASAAESFRTGVAQLRQRNFVGAQRSFSAAVAQAPTWADAYYNRALAYDADGRAELAAADLRHYLQLRAATRDRAAIAERIDVLGRSPTSALGHGLIAPGLGQFYTGRPLLGFAVTAAAAGGIAWALGQHRVVETRTFTDPFGRVDTFEVTVRKRPHLTAGLAAAGAVWLFGAVESALHAARARGDAPLLPSPERSTARSAARFRVDPTVSLASPGPAFGAMLTLPFR